MNLNNEGFGSAEVLYAAKCMEERAMYPVRKMAMDELMADYAENNA
jgi:hypothetical protein